MSKLPNQKKSRQLLVCIYTCDAHNGLLEEFNKSIVVKHLYGLKDTTILLVKADPNTHYDHIFDGTLILKTEESYKNLPKKTHAMVHYLTNNLEFDFLLKIDVTTFTTALRNTLPTGGKLISEPQILEMLCDEEFYREYNGFIKLNARRKGAENWARNKGIEIDYEKVFDSDFLPEFYSGKLWLIDRDFAQYISTNGENTVARFSRYFPAEDVMLGYLYREYISCNQHS